MIINSNIKKIAIIGFGGYSREIACNLPRHTYDFFVSKTNYDNYNNDFKEYNNIYCIDDLNIDKYKILPAIGDPKTREKIVKTFPKSIEFFTYIDKNAIILDKNTIKIGKGSIINAGSILTTNINLGDFSHVNLNSTIGHDVVSGNYLTTAPGVHISGDTSIGKNVYFGTGSILRNKLSICNNVTIGMNSVINKDILEEGVYVGIPAKKIK